MIRHWQITCVLGMLPFLISAIAHAACLPTLGTDDCSREADSQLQVIEHHYLDAPTRNQTRSRLGQRQRSKRAQSASKT
jgi:hypothetical protein